MPLYTEHFHALDFIEVMSEAHAGAFVPHAAIIMGPGWTYLWAISIAGRHHVRITTYL